VTDYEVCRQRPADEKLLPSRSPELVAADAGFFNNENESKAREAGIKKQAIPNKKTRSPARWAYQRERWFRRVQRWCVGCEGRMSVLKRRHGLF
jgi:IS5 family transposase